MGQRIEIQVDKRGNITTDFTGFLGEACFDEADRLAKVLARLGLQVSAGAVRPKPIEQQRLEAGLPEGGESVRAREGR
ncbi:MAG TPA: hypothetical protein VNM16_11340 [Bacillota bacterium]|nr:hypothetical protein [Bacillota bacterium]